MYRISAEKISSSFGWFWAQIDFDLTDLWANLWKCRFTSPVSLGAYFAEYGIFTSLVFLYQKWHIYPPPLPLLRPPNFDHTLTLTEKWKVLPCSSRIIFKKPGRWMITYFLFFDNLMNRCIMSNQSTKMIKQYSKFCSTKIVPASNNSSVELYFWIRQ